MDRLSLQLALERGLHRRDLVMDCFRPQVALKREELHTDSACSKEARPMAPERHRKDLVMMGVVLEVQEVLVH